MLRVATPTLGAAALLSTLAAFLPSPRAVAAEPSTAVGLGTYYAQPKVGFASDTSLPPPADYRTPAELAQAVPTNQWYTSVMFTRWSYALHAIPLTFRAAADGFEVGLPTQQVAISPTGKREVMFPHVAALTVSPASFRAEDARLARHADWLATVAMNGAQGESLSATILHGSPYVFFECSTGDVRVKLASEPKRLVAPGAPDHDGRISAFSVGGHAYAVFAPSGGKLEWTSASELLLHLPPDRRYFTIAGLPDERAETIADFAAHAFAFPTDTRVEWRYDEQSARVVTRFHVDTATREGQDRTTLIGLYPHHWRALETPLPERYRYNSVRGPVRIVEGNEFTTVLQFHGTLPWWPGLEDPKDKDGVDGLLSGDNAKSDQLFLKKGRGTYWIGKAVGALAQLAAIAEVEGRTGIRDDLLKQLRSRLESWFDGRHATHFVHDARLGTFLGYPQEYKSVLAMNDHHFHYGYWITAAAHVALRDPQWAAESNWGGMVGKLIADIATDERGRADFPFLRNFDVYEGHSWASGFADSDAGNNQESSSEAVHAWAGLILWGEATRNRRLRDLGVYLYASEIASIQQYWFDLDRQVLAPEFDRPFASMVFGGKYAWNTWWTEEPRQITLINVVPLTPAATYLGADPAWISRVLARLPGDVKAYEAHNVGDGTPKDIWQDILVSFQALADPVAALAAWDRQGHVEFGETRSHTAFWLASLKELGRPDFSVTADTALYAAFVGAGGAHTYLAYNAGDAPRTVHFSTGAELVVAPHALARGH